ncbi:hypothetical protein [Leptospira ilyithenensis]|uniref:Uncharacterized protein n=1 Tax=Leptospira ilyithenensis TaxID=2484901 RepID=A0A4R9LPZ8_9LEPT|nr:hypothetical protein [Leptospira ilyithenensis]TGN09763.1 hypothetical protein EHS11_11820 [Leptospira ilyithenensis]
MNELLSDPKFLVTATSAALAGLLYLIRNEANSKITTAKDFLLNKLEESNKENKKESLESSIRKHERINEIQKDFIKLEKSVQTDITLLAHKADETSKRFERIENQIEKLDDKIEAQGGVLTQIYNIVSRKGAD